MTFDPDLSDVIDQAVDYRLGGMFFGSLGIVQAYDGSQRRATIVPMVLKIGIDGEAEPIDPISDVPVYMPGTLTSGTSMDVPIGTTGAILFTDGSMDEWLAKTAIELNTKLQITPADNRIHSSTDAMFFPGLSPFAAARATKAGIMEIYNGIGAFQMDSAGRMKLGTDLVDLLGLIDQLLDSLGSAVTVAGGPFNPATLTLFTKIKVQLQTIKLP